MTQKTSTVFKHYILPLFLAALAYFPLFHNLDRLPLMPFDESRVAMSSYEMSENYNLLVVHYDGSPDMWSTKPPLTNWLQVLCIKLLGLNVLAVRLPSALAGLATCILLWLFCTRYLKSYWLAAASIIVLVTARGFISPHVTRTADYDAILVFFITASSFAYYIFIDSGNYKYLRLFFISLALAVLTKSVAGLFMLPGLFVFTLFNYNSLVFLTKQKTWLYFLYFIIPVAAYYLGREMVNPGYLKAVWYWDIAGRYKEQLTGDKPYPGYYLNLIGREHFFHWFWIAVAGIVLGLLIKDKIINRVTLFLTSVALGFLVVLSLAKTQMLWYEAPVYPFLAMLAAVALFWGVDFLQKPTLNLRFNFLPYVLIIAVAYTPYKNTLNRVNPPHLENEWEYEAQAFNYYLIDAYKTGKNLDGYKWIDNDTYNPYIDFYVKMFEKNKGQHITRKNPDELKPGETAIAFHADIKPLIDSAYTFEVLEEKQFVKVYKITGKK